MDYDQALDELYPSLNEWVFYGSSQAKNDLVAAYEALPPNLRRAWDEGLAHHAQTDTPLASKSFGHEKEVILAPGNRAKLVTVLENW